MCGTIGSGVAATLSYYVYTFVFDFSSQQIGYISVSLVLKAIIAFVAAPLIGKTLGKKRGAIVIGLFAFTIVPAKVILWLLGLTQENTSP